MEYFETVQLERRIRVANFLTDGTAYGFATHGSLKQTAKVKALQSFPNSNWTRLDTRVMSPSYRRQRWLFRVG